MTTRHPRLDGADLDLQLLAAQDRMADLRADGASTVHPTPGPSTTTRARAAFGRRLIALGSALTVDEPTRSERSLA